MFTSFLPSSSVDHFGRGNAICVLLLDHANPKRLCRSVAFTGLRACRGRGSAQDLLDVLHNQLDGHTVLGPSWDDHVRVLFGGQTEVLESLSEMKLFHS